MTGAKFHTLRERWKCCAGLFIGASLLVACSNMPAQELPLKRPDTAGAPHARHYAAARTGAPLQMSEDNEVRLLIDGPQTFAAMFAAIENARSTILLQTYIFEADELGQKMAALLIKKRAQGVAVSVLYDSVGSIGTPQVFFQALRAAQINVCEFNPVNPAAAKNPSRRSKSSINHRDHRKMLVVDAHSAFTGGVNVSSVYSHGSSSVGRGASNKGASGKNASDKSASEISDPKKSGWRDTQIEVRGGAVDAFTRLFARTWQKQNCESVSGALIVIKSTPSGRGDKLVRVLGSSPDEPGNEIYDALLNAIGRAERSVKITMAYFVPDPRTIEILTATARRGVEVSLILPGFSDAAVVFHAGRSHYQTLLDAGIRIYERQDVLLHAKTVLVDDVWATVGSSNMDWRSFLHNDEVNAIVLNAAFGREMAALFDRDIARATRIDAQAWSERGLTLRLQERWARIWDYWL